MTKSFGKRTIGLTVLGSLLVLAVVVCFQTLVATAADNQAHLREERLIANGVEDWTRSVERQIAVEANWDDAVRNLGAQFDHDWADANVGQFLSSIAGIEEVYVLDARDKPVYGLGLGGNAPHASYRRLEGAATALVARVRLAEQARPTPVGRPPFKTVISKPIHASALQVVDGQPMIVTATLVQPDFGRVATPRRAPIVITGEALDAAFVAAFSERYLLDGLQVHAEPPSLAANESSVPLWTAAGASAGRIDWSPQYPGRDILAMILPPALVAFLLLLALAGSMLMRSRQAAEALRMSETRAKHMAFHDHLTGIPNRAMFMERLGHALAVARRSSETLGVVTIDLDRFKQVNDTHGHAAGDELIVAVTDRLLAGSREGDLVARLGGDEFAILCAQATMAGMSDFCSRITRALAEPFDLTYGQVFVGASAGVSLVVGGEYEPIEVMRQADLAMYRAKDEGRGRHAFFELEMDQAFRSRQALEADLRKALADGDLTVLYQPQIDQRGRMFGVEALARWNHPVHGPISPSKFVPLAEECGLIEALGRFTLHRAFMDSLAWPRLTVAVNVSAVQLRGSGLPNLLTELLAETGADPRRIELEITEGILMTDDVQTHQLLARIRAMGFSLALDDFGTGYSSLSYLRRYPVDKIKIDRSFISNLGVDDDAEAVVEAIVRLAKALQLKVMGEGVETAAQRTSLLKAGCGSFQGFLYSRPIEFDMVEPLLAGRATERAA